MRIRIPALLSIALLWSGTQAFAAPGDEIGSAVRIINIVTAEYETDERRLETGDNVRQDELIEVSAEGTGEIRLRDDTKLALGPGSQLLLDEFVYNPELSGGAIVLNLVKGTFRFITGIAAKPAYVIRTPTASITVRGTIFDVNVHDSGLAWLLLIEGAIEVCNERDECRLHDEPGKVIWITPDGDLGNPVNWANLPGRQEKPFETAFPFVVAPPLIDPNPIFTPGDFVEDYVPEGPGDDNEDVTPVRPLPVDCWNGWFQIGAKQTKSYIRRGYKVRRHRGGQRTIWCAENGAPPPELPPVDCWNGWFQIGAKQTKSYVRKGYKVRRHRGGQRTIWCAKNGGTLPPPIACPPPAIGKLPFCKCGPGYKGRWPKCREIEPDRPCKRGDVKCHCKLKGLPYNSRTGKCRSEPPPSCNSHDVKCQCKLKGLPYNRKTGKCGYDPSPPNPKKECLKKGWKWKDNRCVKPLSPKQTCLKKGWIWASYRCVKPTSPKQECLKKGWKWTNNRCVKPTSPKQTCLKKGWKWTNNRCVKPSNPKQTCLKKGWKWKDNRCVKPSNPKQKCLKKGWKWKDNRCVKPSNPKQKCLKKGWKWKDNRCVKPKKTCPKGYVGKPPNCKKANFNKLRNPKKKKQIFGGKRRKENLNDPRKLVRALRPR